jgi:hypothetical protein
MDLKEIGFTKEELQDRVVQSIVQQLTHDCSVDDNDTPHYREAFPAKAKDEDQVFGVSRERELTPAEAAKIESVKSIVFDGNVMCGDCGSIIKKKDAFMLGLTDVKCASCFEKTFGKRSKP